MTDRLTHNDMISSPIQKGDCGVVLKPDGSFQLFNCAGQMAAETMSEEQIKTGMKMLVISYLLKNDEVLEELYERMTASGFVEQGIAAPRLHA